MPRSERRRRSVRQLLFVIAGAHTGGFVGSVVPTFGLPGGVASLALVAVLFALPFLVDANRERIESAHRRLFDGPGGRSGVVARRSPRPRH